MGRESLAWGSTGEATSICMGGEGRGSRAPRMVGSGPFITLQRGWPVHNEAQLEHFELRGICTRPVETRCEDIGGPELLVRLCDLAAGEWPREEPSLFARRLVGMSGHQHKKLSEIVNVRNVQVQRNSPNCRRCIPFRVRKETEYAPCWDPKDPSARTTNPGSRHG